MRSADHNVPNHSEVLNGVKKVRHPWTVAAAATLFPVPMQSISAVSRITSPTSGAEICNTAQAFRKLVFCPLERPASNSDTACASLISGFDCPIRASAFDMIYVVALRVAKFVTEQSTEDAVVTSATRRCCSWKDEL